MSGLGSIPRRLFVSPFDYGCGLRSWRPPLNILNCFINYFNHQIIHWFVVIARGTDSSCYHVALSHMVSSLKLCNFVTVTDRGLSHIHSYSENLPRRVTLIDEWPDDFRKVGIVTLTPSRGIFSVSDLAIKSVRMTITGRHRRTGTASK